MLGLTQLWTEALETPGVGPCGAVAGYGLRRGMLFAQLHGLCSLQQRLRGSCSWCACTQVHTYLTICIQAQA
jgi:hypothetical protein